MLAYDTKTNNISPSLVWQYWVVLVSTHWYSFVSLSQLKEFLTDFVILKYALILLSTCQPRVVPFWTRCFLSSLQLYAQITRCFSTFLFDFFTCHVGEFFGCKTILAVPSPSQLLFTLSLPVWSLNLPRLLLPSFITFLWSFTCCLCPSLNLAF